MKKLLPLIALLAIPAAAQNSHDTYYCGNPNTPCIIFGSYGVNMGKLGRISEGVYGLSYGTSMTSMGTSALTWDTSGAVSIPGRLAVTGAITGGTLNCTSASYTNIHAAGDVVAGYGSAYASTMTAASGNIATPGSVTAIGGFVGALVGNAATVTNGAYTNAANSFTGNNNFSIEFDTAATAGAGALNTITCPSGKYALNGGCSCTGGVSVTSEINRPNPVTAGAMPTGWSCQEAGGTGGDCVAFVTCGKIKF